MTAEEVGHVIMEAEVRVMQLRSYEPRNAGSL